MSLTKRLTAEERYKEMIDKALNDESEPIDFVNDGKVDKSWKDRPEGEFGIMSATTNYDLDLPNDQLYEGGIIKGRDIEESLARPITDYSNVNYEPVGTESEAKDRQNYNLMVSRGRG